MTRPKALDMMVTYLRDDMDKYQHEIDNTRGCHARFSFLVKVYEDHLDAAVDAVSDGPRFSYHKACAPRSYFMILVTHAYLWTKV